MKLSKLTNLISDLKGWVKQILPTSVLDKYLKLRLSPQKYRLHRIKQYEESYDGSIIKLNDYYYRLHLHESVSRNLYADKIFSNDVINFLHKLLPYSESFLDIGANIGSVTIPTIGKYTIPTLAIEPVLENYNLLRENLFLNKIDQRVTTLQAAVGDKNGRTQIFLSPNNSGDHRLHKTDTEDRIIQDTRLVTLDQCIKDYQYLKPPYLVKVDVQGNETYVLRGSQILSQYPCVFVIELWPWGLGVSNSSVIELEQAYRELGFNAYVIRFNDVSFGLQPVDNLSDLTDEIPSDWGAHLELLLTNQSLQSLKLHTHYANS